MRPLVALQSHDSSAGSCPNCHEPCGLRLECPSCGERLFGALQSAQVAWPIFDPRAVQLGLVLLPAYLITFAGAFDVMVRVSLLAH